MKNFHLLLPIIVLGVFSCNENKPTVQEYNTLTTADTLTNVEVLDAEVETLVDKNGKAEILGEGFIWSEGPCWLKDQQKLIFSDAPQNTIFSWTAKDSIQVYLKPSGYTSDVPRGGEVGSNGLIVNKNGNLVLCQHGDRRIAEMLAPLDSPKAEFKTLAGKYDGKRFSSPNDVFADSKGNYYFTDPPYGLEKQDKDSTKETKVEGVYRIRANGNVELLVDSLTRPNGLIVSNDGKKLYVANSDPAKAIWAVYDLDSAGKISNGKIFMNATAKAATEKGLPDGLCMNSKGYIFATGPGGVWIFNPAGKHIGTIKTTVATSNVELDDTESYLYITAHMYLIRMKLVK